MTVVFNEMPYWSRTDWEKLSPSTEYGVLIGRTVVGPDILECFIFQWEGGKGGMVVKWEGGKVREGNEAAR